MDNRTEVMEDRELFAKLVEAIKWYDAMPAGVQEITGDRFHEDMHDYIDENFPTIPETDGEDAEYFVGDVSTSYLTDQDGTHDTIVAEVVLGDDEGMSHTVTFR